MGDDGGLSVDPRGAVGVNGGMRRRLAVILLFAHLGRVAAQTRTVDQPTAAPPERERSHWRVGSDTILVAYEVRSPRSPVTWERRRLVQYLALDHALQPSAPKRWRLVSHLELRFDQELGQVCVREEHGGCLRDTDVEARREYQPLAEDSRLDMPAAWLELQGPRATRLRAGRLLVADAAGVARLDGARVSTQPRPWLDLAAYAGRRTRDTSYAASSGLEPQGSIRWNLPSGLAPERVPWAAPPSHTWMVGGQLSVGLAKWVRVRGSAREVRDGDGVVARRVGVGLTSSPHPALALRLDAVWDPTDGALVDALAEVEARQRAWTLRARAERHLPRFDLGSIWAWFDLVPVDRARVSFRWRARFAELGGAWQGRRAVQEQRAEVDLGGEGWLKVRRGGWRATLRGWLWAGDFQPVAALLFDLSRVLGVVEVYLRSSVWHFDHPFRSELYGTSLTAALGVKAALTEVTHLRFEIEWTHNRVAGHRLRGLAAVSVRAWR